MKDHWCFYCDESGEFENIGQSESILVGLLVPEDDKEMLAEKYFELKGKHNLDDDFIHTTTLHKQKDFIAFKKDLIALTLSSSIKLLRMTYREDLLDKSAGQISESFACNRYLYMIEAFIEHFLFYVPEDYGKLLAYTINPNSRVFPCSDSQIPQMKALGFTSVKKKKMEIGKVNVWDASGLRIFLNRLQLEHSIHAAVLGERRINAIDLQVAKCSRDPFVHWADVLAWQLMWRPKEANSRRLIDSLHVDALYGNEDQTYKGLCRLFLSGRHKEFIEQYLLSIPNLTSVYYQHQLEALFNKGVNEMGAVGLSDLLSLEAMADEALRRSRGNWRFVSSLVDKLFELADRLPEAEARLDKANWLKFRLNNHRLSYHNHRGEILPAWKAAGAIDALDLRLKTIDQWRTWAEYQNRRSVTHANLFSFEEGNRALASTLGCLEQTLECLNTCSGLVLQDEILGKVRGTVAQNFAFLAPFQSESFERAENMFLSAKAQFDKPADRLRQNTYLGHLYIDAGRFDKLMGIWAEIEQDPAFKAFWESPDAKSARYMQFVVALQLKIAAHVTKREMGLLKRYIPSELRAWFGQAMDEHPFELIYSYLGQLAALQDGPQQAAPWFRKALTIPDPARAPRQVTVEAIRAQILGRWALLTNEAGDKKGATEKLEKVIAIMKRIGKDPNYRPVLGLKGSKAVSGWFKDGYQALLDAGNRVDIEACRSFFRCFTFNYW